MTHRSIIAVFANVLLSPSGVAQQITWDTSHWQQVTGDIRSLGAADEHGILSALHAHPEELHAIRVDSLFGPMFLAQGVGAWCGNVNCEFWILDSNYHILLKKVTEAYSILPHLHNGHPDVLTYMHGSAFEGGLNYWRFQSGRYVRIRCADESSEDSDGNTLNKPRITPRACGTGG